jgi:hypothetical protein
MCTLIGGELTFYRFKLGLLELVDTGELVRILVGAGLFGDMLATQHSIGMMDSDTPEIEVDRSLMPPDCQQRPLCSGTIVANP